MIDFYDPNNSFGKTKWRLTFKAWEYELAVECEVGGNCKGLSTLEAVISLFLDGCYDEKSETYKPLIFKDKEGNELEYSLDEEYDPEEELKDLLVKAEMISFEKE